jgi:hypothetical protein
MESVRQFFMFVSLTSLLCLLIGLFRPWMVLWWEDVQNRKKVIKVYGTAALIGYALYCGLFLI